MCLAALLALTVPVFGQTKPSKVAKPILEGYIRDQSGNPVVGVRVTVNQGSYETQGHRDVIPLFIPKTAVGAIVFDDPNVVESHDINGHAATTDAKGHYSFKSLAAGRYTLWASPTKKNFTTGWGEIVVKEKLARKYTFPSAAQVVLTGGQKTQHDVVLGLRADAANKQRRH
jgi:hypothetical protein